VSAISLISSLGKPTLQQTQAIPAALKKDDWRILQIEEDASWQSCKD
jgi:hypothetical protein